METRWNRTKHAFEKILEEGEKAAEKMFGSLEEMGDAAKVRLEKARLERALFKRFAELGNGLYELHKAAKQVGSTEMPPATSILEDPKIKPLLEQVASLDEELMKIEG